MNQVCNDIPEANIILATVDSLKEVIELKEKMHPYLNLLISKNNGKYQLHFVYKLLMRIQK